MKRQTGIAFFALTIALIAGSAASAGAATSITAATLKKAGANIVSCPLYIGHYHSGLFTSVLKKNSLCMSNASIPTKARSLLKTYRFAIDGTASTGSGFPAIVNQEGDVQTQPFTITNYPAIISYAVEESDFQSQFQIAVVNADTGKTAQVFVRSRGSVSGEVAWSIPGRFYLKMNAYGSNKTNLQPLYSASIRFIDRYTGLPVSTNDLKAAGVKTTSCPRYVLSTETGRAYQITTKFFCTSSKSEKIESAGLTYAPLSLPITLFMVTDISMSGFGGTSSLPFRILSPAPLQYSVADPAEKGHGRFIIDLINPATGKQTSELVNTTGTIDGTTTSVNVSGDYYMYLVTQPYNPQTYGDMGWDISIQTPY